MGKVLALVVGVLMFAVGVLWTLQGLGYVGGSSMTGDGPVGRDRPGGRRAAASP